MKSLTKAKIINWHYFWNQTIEFKQIVFLTGKNASGKSTLIDALSLVLLGDTTGRFFNKAAMDKSARTLKGYLRGEIGDTAEGDFKYLRNGRFTSYVVLEFYDDIHDSYFTMGIVFDTSSDGSEEHHFFSTDDKILDNEYIVNKYPMEYKDLAKYFAEHYNKDSYQFFDSNRQYQDFLKNKFGGLRDKYFSLLKKASSFSPITDITTFITEYVCDPQANINLESLQENILQYKKLEKEAEAIELRVNQLEEISNTYKIYESNKEKLTISQYIIERCNLEMSKDKLNSFKNEVLKATKRINEIEVELNENKSNLDELERRRANLISDKANNDTVKITDELIEEKREIKEKIDQIKLDEKLVKDNLIHYTDNYIKASDSLLKKLSTFDRNFLDEDRDRELLDLEHDAQVVFDESMKFKDNYINNLMALNKDTLDEYRAHLTSFKNKVSSLATSIARSIQNIEKKISSLKEEERGIRDTGTKPYDQNLLIIKNRLQAELKEKFNKEIPVEIYADLVDIKDLSWSNAIEGFLGNQRFSLFVAPRYYIDAYKIFRRLLEQQRLYGIALIDQEKIIDRDFEADDGSLATEIITDHDGARAYTNFLIGRLHKSATIEEARDSGNGITKECDVYRNFAFNRINPRIYQNSYIGRKLDARFLKEKSTELNSNLTNLGIFRGLHSVITEANNLEVINTNEINNITKTIEKLAQLKGLNSSLEYIENELSEHDTTLINSLDKRLKDVSDDISSINKSNESLILEKGNLVSEIKTLKSEKIKLEESKIVQMETNLANNYDVEFVNDKCIPVLENELDSRKNYIQIQQEYNAGYTRLNYVTNNIFSQLIKLRRDYLHDYHQSFDSDKVTNDEFDNELNEFKEVKLPQYKAKIEDSYHKATQQFKDDFIYKLRSAIEDVEDQIANLNVALKESSFGNDLYRFTVKPSQIYRRYYDMLKDNIILETGEDESAFLDKYKDVMEDLFRQIVDIGNNEKNSALLQNIEKFTDYRSYLDFDLIVYNKNSKEEQRLSKMIKKKSGGETQTPFYISVLASFAQLYHVHDEGEISNTIRIIIFDEAFSKMDRERIVEAVKLLRRFNLQVILSTPPEKIGDIAELVDETLLVSRDKNSSCVLLYSKED